MEVKTDETKEAIIYIYFCEKVRGKYFYNLSLHS